MRSSVLKSIVLASSIVIASLVVLQLIWLNKQFTFEQKNFSINVMKSIREVYNDMPLIDNMGEKLGDNIERIDNTNFLFKVDKPINKDSLIPVLVKELENFEVFSDCNIAYYNFDSKKYDFEFYVRSAGSIYPALKSVDMKNITRDFSFIHIFFPHRSKYIISGLWIWISLSILLILTLLALSISLFYLYKQKFLNEIQKDFINNVTHEFQTPLTTLQLGLDALTTPSIINNPEKISKYTSVMLTQTNYLRHHLENLMLVIRADADVLRFQKEEVDMNRLIRDAVEQLSVVAQEKNTKFDFQLDPQLPNIIGDRNNLFLVLINLISNAIKYSKNPLVEISTQSNGNYISITVKDNGIGFDPKLRKHLFHKFYRIPSGDLHDTKGLGLGLYFTKKIVTLHKGTVEVNSEPDKGSEFKIILPIN